jgi:hypothetical protein
LKKNTECSVVDRIVLLNEKAMGQPLDGKIREQVIGKRLTYADVIRWIYEEAPEDVLIAFANADIFLDDKLHMNAKGYDLWKGVVGPVLVD